jgi:hypothetical protein
VGRFRTAEQDEPVVPFALEAEARDVTIDREREEHERRRLDVGDPTPRCGSHRDPAAVGARRRRAAALTPHAASESQATALIAAPAVSPGGT